MKYVIVVINTASHNRDKHIISLGEYLYLDWNIVRADCTHDTIIYILSKDGE